MQICKSGLSQFLRAADPCKFSKVQKSFSFNSQINNISVLRLLCR